VLIDVQCGDATIFCSLTVRRRILRDSPPVAATLRGACCFQLTLATVSLPPAHQVLLPLVNVPMLNYTLEWLASAGVEEAFVFCCAHAAQVRPCLHRAATWLSSGTPLSQSRGG
jgi:translation initiation factor eIF-2B subunit epsilon